ncbi:MAG: class I SAM-dependent methyltransferase [Opitutales bacterium]|nr:class I SAM-dependent methyltransferase [Opitutales bacterium]
MAYTEFVSLIHKSTKRDYVARVVDYPKEVAAEKAKKWAYDYWDGDRKTGYGGYKYDGRWQKVAKAMIEHYRLKPGDRILDVGSGKGFLLHDFKELLPEVEIQGIDISEYAKEHAVEDVRDKLLVACATDLPFESNSFDLVISITTLHNLPPEKMVKALKEIERVRKKNAYVCVESFRNETEKVNLMYWQLTCECFARPNTWAWYFETAGYTGDHEFIYFE